MYLVMINSSLKSRISLIERIFRDKRHTDIIHFCFEFVFQDFYLNLDDTNDSLTGTAAILIMKITYGSGTQFSQYIDYISFFLDKL